MLERKHITWIGWTGIKTHGMVRKETSHTDWLERKQRAYIHIRMEINHIDWLKRKPVT